MTRTAISSCKQFNKMCVCYPAVITNWYPSTPHKGVNGDIRHDYTGSLPSRQTSSLCKELGGDYPGPMGPAGNSRVQIRPDSNPSPGKQASCAVSQSNRPYPDNRGGTRTAGQTGHKGISTLPKQFYFPTFPGGKERGWAKASGQSEGSKQFCALRALQDGRPPHSPGPDSDRGLYDQARSERCISSDPNPSGSPTSPPISVDGENIPILMPSFWADLSSKGIHKGAKTTNWNTQADGDSISGLLGRYPYPPSGQGGARESSPFDLQPFRSTGISDQHQEILTSSPTEHRIPGISDKVSDSANSDATGEAEENPARCQRVVTTTSISHCAGSSPFCGKNHSLMQGNLASSPTLQGNPSLDELSVSRGRRQLSPNRPVQYQASPIRGSTTGPSLVGITRSNCTITSPPSTKSSQYDHTSDASTTGWGACLGDTTTGGTWSAQEMMHHINYLELLAAFLAVQCFLKTENNITILLKLDNVTAVTFINWLGGTHSKPLCQLALAFWEWCIPRNLFLIAEHLPGQQNVLADHESRSLKDRCDWMINPQLLHQIQDQLGPCQVDLFASRLTRQLPRYFSWRIDPQAEAVDAFKQDWSQYRGFANPPWCLIPRCLSQARAQKSRLILLTPLWPSQAWYPVVLEMLEDIPRQLPNQEDLIFLHPGQEFQMPQGCPNLVAWPISGNPSHHEEFLRKLQHSSYTPGDLRPSPATTQHLLNGLVGVTSGTEIPLLAL